MHFAGITHPCGALLVSMAPALTFPENYIGGTVFANVRIIVSLASDTLR